MIDLIEELAALEYEFDKNSEFKTLRQIQQVGGVIGGPIASFLRYYETTQAHSLVSDYNEIDEIFKKEYRERATKILELIKSFHSNIHL